MRWVMWFMGLLLALSIVNLLPNEAAKIAFCVLVALLLTRHLPAVPRD